MRDLPSGTVTLLFTDIEGSTRLLEALGDGYADALAEHGRVLREAFARHGGVEVDTQGDAFFYAFRQAADAVAAAQEAQQALLGGPVAVRMGVHTGEPIVTAEGYVGIDVHRTARIMGAGHGGQVLLSRTTRALLDSSSELLDLGEHRLKDLANAEWLFQLGVEEFPPLRSLNVTNLPLPSAPLLGRKKELADVLRRLREERARLLTITGPGGIGKTRFALETGRELVEDYRHGVFFVDLSPLRDPALVLPTIAATLGAKTDLTEHIADKGILLLLDNFEQVVDAAGTLSAVVAACPNLQVLVTSREPLHVAAEGEYALRPLAESPAVELFRRRAEASDPSFDAPYEDVKTICDRLDRLPLAIELAAARVKVLPPDELASRLQQRLPLLTSRARDLPERQRTLRATIEWSYELCSPDEQELFGRLGVFAGGWTLEAAEEVADADLDTLESLVDKSLARREGDRFSMLETIREFAAEHVDEETRRRHVGFLLELGAAANLREDAAGEQRPDLAAPERDNLRAALAWALANEPELGLRLLVETDAFWVMNATREGMRWAEALLEAATALPLELRARALRDYGGFANPEGETELAERLYEESLEAFRQLGDERGIAHLLMRLAHAAYYRGDVPRARELAAESLPMSRATGDRRTESLLLGLEGELRYRDGDVEGGMELVEQAARLATEFGFTWQRTRMLRKLVDCAVELGRWGDAKASCLEALTLSRQLGDRQAQVFALARLARIAGETGEAERAGRLWGAVEAEEERGGLGAWHDLRKQFAAPVLAHAGAEFGRGRTEGRRLTLAEAAEEALERAP